jgi:hypothetical protein
MAVAAERNVKIGCSQVDNEICQRVQNSENEVEM